MFHPSVNLQLNLENTGYIIIQFQKGKNRLSTLITSKIDLLQITRRLFENIFQHVTIQTYFPKINIYIFFFF